MPGYYNQVGLTDGIGVRMGLRVWERDRVGEAWSYRAVLACCSAVSVYGSFREGRELGEILDNGIPGRRRIAAVGKEHWVEIEENEVTGLSADFLPLAVLLVWAIFGIAFKWLHSSCVGSQLA